MATPNPDEFEPRLDGTDKTPQNIARGKADADQAPHKQGDATPYSPKDAQHPGSPNYGDFGHAADAAAPDDSFQPRYGQETPPDDTDQTKHGDERFRHSGTQNIDTAEPANPHHGPEDKHNT